MNEDLQPLTISESGTAPKSRFSGYSGLYSAYQEARRANDRNDARFASIRGLFDGNPPVDPRWMEENGMEDMPNINTREYTAKINQYVSTWVDHNCSGFQFAKVVAKRSSDEETPEDIERYSNQLTKFFNEAFLEWSDSETTQSAAHYILKSAVRDMQMGLFGIGIPNWEDDVDWRWRVVPTRKFLVPFGTSITLDNCPVAFLESESTVTKLYRKVKRAGDDDGWNKDAVYKLLHRKTQKSGGGPSETFSEWQNRLRNNDDGFLMTDFSGVELVDCYVQEFQDNDAKDGISHYVIARAGQSTEVLYKKEKAYESFGEITRPFCDSPPPEEDWHGVKGFGDQSYDLADLNNILFNNIAQSAIVMNMPMWMTSNETDREKVPQIRWTRNGILNPGINISQVTLKTDISGSLQVLQESKRTSNTNSRIFPQGETMGGESKTATQSVFDRQDQASFTTLQIKSYRICLDGLFSEMYRRLNNYDSKNSKLPGHRAANNFRKKCDDAKIPEECRKNPLSVLADRSGGSGNMALDSMKADEVFKVASPGRGQNNARKEKIKALVGTDRVAEFFEDEPIIPEVQEVINLENSQLQDGRDPGVLPMQNHGIHLGDPTPDGTGHLTVLIVAYGQAQQLSEAGVETQMDDAQKLSRILEASLTHCAQHVGFMEQMPLFVEITKVLNKTINDVGQFLQTFNQEIGRVLERQQQEQGNQMTPEMVQKMINIQLDAQRAQQAMEINQAKQEQKLVHKEMSAEQKRAQQQQDFDLTQGKKAQDAMVEFERKQAMTAQDLAAAEAKTRAQGNAEKVTTE